MKITQTLLDKLTEKAKASPRVRMNYDLEYRIHEKEWKKESFCNVVVEYGTHI